MLSVRILFQKYVLNAFFDYNILNTLSDFYLIEQWITAAFPSLEKNASLKQEKVYFGYVFCTIFSKNSASFIFCFWQSFFVR